MHYTSGEESIDPGEPLLRLGFGLFVEQQSSLREQMQSMMTADPLSFMREMTEKNMTLWKDMQESFFRSTGGTDESDGGRREP